MIPKQPKQTKIDRPSKQVAENVRPQFSGVQPQLS